MKTEYLVDFESSVVLHVRLQLYAREQRISFVKEAMRRKVNHIVVSRDLLEPRLSRLRTNHSSGTAAEGSGNCPYLTGGELQLGNGRSQGHKALARRLRRRRHGQRPGHWQVGHHVIFDKESIPPASRTYQCRKWKIMEEPVGNDGDFAGSLQPTGFLDGVHEHAPQAPGRQLPIARTGSPYQVTKQSYFGFQIYRAYRFKHCVETVVT